MKKLIALALIFLAGKISAQTFPVTTILYNGSSTNHIDLVFLADGFTSSEQSNFITQATNASNALFAQTPYAQYKNLFNVYAIQVPSTQSGVKHPGTASDCATANPTVPISNPTNYFGSTFDYGGIHRLVVATNTAAIQSVLLANFPAYNKAIVIANSIYYGGSGGTYPCITINNASAEILIHELGHSLANLTDEYTYGGCGTVEKPNCTMETNPTLIKWKSWIPSGMPIPTAASTNCGSVGLYLGANYCPTTWYRPMCSCKMLALGQSFCSVCCEELIVSFLTMANLIDSYSPSNGSASVIGNGGSMTFSVTVLQSIPNTIKKQWLIDNNVVATNTSNYTVIGNSLTTGTHTLTLKAWDTTTLVKKSVPVNSVSWTLSITNNSSVTFSAISPVCANASAFTLTQGSPSGGTYSGTGVSGGIFYPASAGVGTFTLTYTYNSVSATTSVQVKAVPGVSVPPTSTSICSGASTTLSVTGATTYSWSPSTTLSSSTASSVTASPTSATTYSVTGTTNGCSATSTTSVSVIALPVFSVSGNSSLCSGSSTSLTASGATTYSWSPATGLNLTTGSSVIANPASSITYTITGTANGCSKQQNFSLTINAIPVLTASSNTSVCAGTSTSLSVSGATTYSWSPSTGLNSSTASLVTSTPASSLTYTITGTTSGCSSTKTISVGVNAVPSLSGTSSSTICAGASTSLSVSGATTYSWSPSIGLSSTTATSVTANPNSSTTYSVTGTSNGCSSVKTISVTVNALPTISTSGNTTICNSGSATLTASGASTYTWSPSTGLSVTIGSSVSAHPTSSTTYTITGTSASGCVATNTVSVTVSSNLILTVTGTSTICSGNSTSLSVTGAATYSWSPSSSLNTSTGTVVTATPASNTTYTVTGTSGTCSTTKTFSVTVNTSPTVSVSGNSSLCSGGGITLTASGASTYSWSPTISLSSTTSSSVTATPTSTITYTLIGTASNGCTKSTTKTISVSITPTLTYTSVNPTSGSSNGSINITVSGGTSPYTYLWSNGATAEDISSVAAGTFTVSVYAGACTKTQSVTLTNTTGSCTTTTGASFINPTTSSIVAMWGNVAGAYRYNLRSRPVGSSFWTLQSTTGNNAAASISGLTPATMYELQIQTQCDAAGTNLSAYSVSYNFSTSATREEDENNFSATDVEDLNVNLFPNPTNDFIHLQLSNPSQQNFEISLYDMSGREISKQNLTEGETEIIISLQGLAQGLYNVVIVGADVFEQKKILKL